VWLPIEDDRLLQDFNEPVADAIKFCHKPGKNLMFGFSDKPSGVNKANLKEADAICDMFGFGNPYTNTTMVFGNRLNWDKLDPEDKIIGLSFAEAEKLKLTSMRKIDADKDEILCTIFGSSDPSDWNNENKICPYADWESKGRLADGKMCKYNLDASNCFLIGLRKIDGKIFPLYINRICSNKSTCVQFDEIHNDPTHKSYEKIVPGGVASNYVWVDEPTDYVTIKYGGGGILKIINMNHRIIDLSNTYPIDYDIIANANIYLDIDGQIGKNSFRADLVNALFNDPDRKTEYPDVWKSAVYTY
jgi:hypothetical protein